MKLIHNPACSKSQSAVSYLTNNGLEAELLNYIQNPMNTEQIEELLVKLNIPAESLVRKSESIYRTNFEGKKLTELEWIKAMVKFPILIERPIFVKGDKAIIARPIEKLKEIL